MTAHKKDPVERGIIINYNQDHDTKQRCIAVVFGQVN